MISPRPSRNRREGRGYCVTSRPFSWHWRLRRHSERQWSFSFDGFGGHGHTFNEISTPSDASGVPRRLQYFFAVDRVTGPLSARVSRPISASARKRKCSDRPRPIRIRPIRKQHDSITGRRRRVVSVVGQQCLHLRRAPGASHVAAGRGRDTICRNWACIYPDIHVLETTDNVEKVRRMHSLRANAVGAALWVGLLLLLVVQIRALAGRVRPPTRRRQPCRAAACLPKMADSGDARHAVEAEILGNELQAATIGLVGPCPPRVAWPTSCRQLARLLAPKGSK